MGKKAIKIINQDLIARIKELRDTFSTVDVELGLANQATLNVLGRLMDSSSADYPEEDMARLANSVLKRTDIIRDLLTAIDEITKGLRASQ